MEGRKTERALVWPARKISESLMRDFGRALQEEVERRLETFISPQNQLRFRHGDRWSIRRTDDSEDAGSFQRIQSLLPMSYGDVVHNDLPKLADTMNAQAEALTQQSIDLLMNKVDEAVKATGNEVSFDEAGSFAEGYIETISRAKFSVNNEGDVTPPNLYAGPELGAEIERRVAEQGRAFKLRVQEILATKASEAAREERQRLSNYEGFEEDGE